MGIQRLGLEPGEAVRFRRPDRGRWQDGVATGIERDGSLAVSDRDGAHRAVPVELVLVKARGRGRGRWEPLLERAARTVQLHLF
ncbi:MAG TPA: hypothetical protein VM143_02130 [Acidimicrobiales bacterium]|nr:hypothetical protein [Acidimicrobiales bacterium]